MDSKSKDIPESVRGFVLAASLGALIDFGWVGNPWYVFLWVIGTIVVIAL